MTEGNWLSATDPVTMLALVRRTASDRKLRLFAVLCFKEYLRFRPDQSAGIFAEWADITERYADGLVTFEEWDGVRKCVHGMFHATDPQKLALTGVGTAFACCPSKPSEAALLSQHIRDIFGNPFRTVAFDPSWLTSDVRLLATGIYADRAFDRMPILADSLQDAGCDNEDILNHCRDANQVHTRGCWVVDLVLGRE